MMGFNPELKLLQTPTRQMKETAIQALIDVGLGNRMYDNFQSLSAGQKQLCIFPLLNFTLFKNLIEYLR